jgi:hypothetical protein
MMSRNASRRIFLPALLALACGCNPRMALDSGGGSDVFVTGSHAKLAGVGSRALTDRLAATYFIRSADPKGDMVIDFVVFLKGVPGWTERKTGWSFGTSEPVAFSRYTIFATEFRVELDLTTGTGKVLGRSLPTSTANIVVVDGFGEPALTVSYVEHQDLRVPFDADPMRAFVQRSPALRHALELTPPPGESP